MTEYPAERFITTGQSRNTYHLRRGDPLSIEDGVAANILGAGCPFHLLRLGITGATVGRVRA